jgi:diguanylate cyclase (GGDEF)-like protein
MRILVADDNIVSRRPLEVILERWGYEVLTASSGTEAWEILKGPDAPRIAILDWMMPGLSGPEVCQLVRHHNREYYTYILMLTSRHEREDFITGMEAGADDYLVKPPDHRELSVRLGPARRIVELEAELLRIKENLRIQATRDSLTGVWNRNAIFEILAKEAARCEREGHSLGLLLCDLDHFKKINDTYGHVVGDFVLKESTERMTRVVRHYDAIGRYGGEEFLIILPGCDLATAERRAEAIRGSICSEPFVTGDVSVTVTVSFGATCVGGGLAAASEKLIQYADTALYEAKRRGRNRTIAIAWQ